MEKKCACHRAEGRIKKRSPEEHKRLVHRLNRIEGQIRGIRSMIENDAYCVDILMQTCAASAALDSFSKEILSEHIKTCVSEDIKSGKEETIDELVKTLLKLIK